MTIKQILDNAMEKVPPGIKNTAVLEPAIRQILVKSLIELTNCCIADILDYLNDHTAYKIDRYDG
jgi:spore coat protein CotF